MPRAEPVLDAGPPAAPAQEVTPALLRGWPLPEPDEAGDKHDRGTVVVLGGASSTPGAVLLAGLGALRVGAGRLSIVTVASTASGLGVALPEALVQGLPEQADGSLAPGCARDALSVCEGAAAVVLGPGLLGRDTVRALLADLLPGLGAAAVLLDAVALTAVAAAPELLADVAGRVVLTPNSGELAALLSGDHRTGGRDGGNAEAAPADAALRVAERYRAVVAVRGLVAAPDGRLWRNTAGGIGLGTSGSGDVLAGAVGGLLARGCPPEQAAVWGQHLHAVAGDRLAGRIGRLGFLARELLDELPGALATVQGAPARNSE